MFEVLNISDVYESVQNLQLQQTESTTHIFGHGKRKLRSSQAILDPYTTKFGSAFKAVNKPEMDQNMHDNYDTPSYLGLTQLPKELEESMKKKIEDEAKQQKKNKERDREEATKKKRVVNETKRGKVKEKETKNKEQELKITYKKKKETQSPRSKEYFL